MNHVKVRHILRSNPCLSRVAAAGRRRRHEMKALFISPVEHLLTAGSNMMTLGVPLYPRQAGFNRDLH